MSSLKRTVTFAPVVSVSEFAATSSPTNVIGRTVTSNGADSADAGVAHPLPTNVATSAAAASGRSPGTLTSMANVGQASGTAALPTFGSTPSAGTQATISGSTSTSITPVTTSNRMTGVPSVVQGGTTGTAGTDIVSQQVTYRQLQNMLNKFEADIQEQEKLFLDEATKMNARDKVLIANGAKIMKISSTLESVKADHKRVESGVTYLKMQQVDFENALEQLELSIPSIVSGDVYPCDRASLYETTSTVGNELLQMGGDIKEVINTINESTNPGATANSKDPVVNILKILNEHMDALELVEKSSTEVKAALTDLNKQHTNAKRAHLAALRRAPI